MQYFRGYRRDNESIGIRNHVCALSIMGLANPLVRRLTQCVKGTIPIYTSNGRGQVGKDRAQLEKCLVGLAKNPNVGAVLLVSYEKSSLQPYIEQLQGCGKNVQTLSILENQGSIRATERGIRILSDMLIHCSIQQREKFPLSKLTIALECGSSDPTSGKISNPILGEVADRIIDMGAKVIFSETVELLGTEKILAARAANKQIADQIQTIIQRTFDEAKSNGVDIKSVNPVPENLNAGLETLEDKSLGALMKTGSKEITGVLEYAEEPVKPGLYFMDTPFFSTESLTGMTAAGAQITLFSTGVGNNIATPITPAIKITGNPDTQRLMDEHIDLDISVNTIPDDDKTQRIAAVFNEMLNVCNGKLTHSEVLDETDISVSRLGPSV